MHPKSAGESFSKAGARGHKPSQLTPIRPLAKSGECRRVSPARKFFFCLQRELFLAQTHKTATDKAEIDKN